MADTKIQTVQEIYEAFGRGDVATILDKVADDVDWASEPASSIAPGTASTRARPRFRSSSRPSVPTSRSRSSRRSRSHPTRPTS